MVCRKSVSQFEKSPLLSLYPNLIESQHKERHSTSEGLCFYRRKHSISEIIRDILCFQITWRFLIPVQPDE